MTAFLANVRHTLTLIIGLICALASCSPADEPARPDSGVAEGVAVTLVPTFTVRVAGSSVEFMLRLANGGSTAVPLAFGSAQRYDFVVSDLAGAEVWRWSSDQMFAQVMGTESLEPEAALEYRAIWDPGELQGGFRAEARLLSSDRPVTLTTEFELAGG